MFGYDIGVSGGVTSTDEFLKEFFHTVYEKRRNAHENNYCKFNNQGLAAFNSSLYIAGLVATLVASPITRNYGRRVSIICAGIFFLIGAAVNAGSMNLAMLLLGRIMLANMISYATQRLNNWGWRLSLGSAALPALLMTLGGYFLLESPNSLIERGFAERGREVLEKLRETENVEAEFQDMIDASELANSVKHRFKDILRKCHRPQLIMAILMPMFQILTGTNCVLFYAPIIFMTMGILHMLVIFFSLFIMGYGWSWGPLGWTIPSEIFPLATHSAGQSITVAVNLLFTFILFQAFLYLLCALKFGFFLFFAGCVSVMTIFVYFMLPETKGVPIEEVTLIWRKHWFWKKLLPANLDTES
ncbi:unnamed protein product [Thlaspi arvense]|uniref:Major facilitator superfamily (MFS) profile domain-containing protein n=1 Tax=Thlaspi arvense TaxID=13288 RepID=A0AAU9SBU6_THLAR|nr:unnamed protein product [Thlaspi arvense]